MNYLIVVAIIILTFLSLNFFILKQNKKNLKKKVNLLLFDYEARQILMNNKSMIYFYSSTCVNCKLLKPIINQVKGKINSVIEININDYPLLKKEFGILGVPTIALMNKNTLVEILTGMQNEDKLLAAYDKI